jgi:ATP-dependent DNA helicase RecG
VKGIGPRRAEALEGAGLRTVEDLLLHLPFRYEDRSAFLPIAALQAGVRATVRGRVVNAVLRRTRARGLTIFEILVEDDSGSIRALFFNQPYLKTLLPRGRDLILYGEAAPARGDRHGLVLQSPQIEVVTADDGEAIHTGRMVPIYPRLPEMSTRLIRRVIHGVLQALPADLPEPLPVGAAGGRGFPPRRRALEEVHFPPRDADPAALETRRTDAHRRLIFEEFFFLQLGFAMSRQASDARGRAGALLQVDDALRDRLRAVLPFRLTNAQRKALQEIARDLMSARPMNRLLQGDVGCGKTMVALLAALLVVENGLQAAFMVPTEILAEQHHRNFTRLLEGRGRPVGLLTASVQGSARRQVLQGLRAGTLPLVVGTHALTEDEVAFRDLRLAVIDEQHRFGVMQRARLRAKGRNPDVLVMTATPIPRTLALTVYGDLAVSEIAKPPASRKPVVTRWIPEDRASEAYRRLTRLLREGRQAYVVCPLIEESETSRARAAEQEADRLRRAELKGFRVACLHGKLKPADRRELMARFNACELDVLVATTVIEVGVDVPNATVMIVQEADRFGLAQLHQLRGRVGRGAEQSYCLLVSRPKEELTEGAGRRLEALVETTDGFELAEVDLELRGEGQLLGTRQSGLSDLHFTRLRVDRPLLERARAAALELVDEHGPLDDALAELFPEAGLAA